MVNTVVNGYNVGTDASLTITDNYGDSFSADQLGYLMDFESESEDVQLKITPVTNGGVPIYQTIWNGISGKMTFTRANANFQQAFMDLMNAYYTNGVIPQFTISLNVRDRNGAIDEYLYTGVQFEKPRFGNYRATKEVDMSLAFKASQMQPNGTGSAFLTGVASAG